MSSHEILQEGIRGRVCLPERNAAWMSGADRYNNGDTQSCVFPEVISVCIPFESSISPFKRESVNRKSLVILHEGWVAFNAEDRQVVWELITCAQ